MKAAGIVREVDPVGRIVIPKELRSMLNIRTKDPVEIFTEDEYIILRKYQPFCIFCDNSENLQTIKEKKICKNCIDSIKKTGL